MRVYDYGIGEKILNIKFILGIVFLENFDLVTYTL